MGSSVAAMLGPRKLKITAMWRGVELPVPLHTDSAARNSAMA
jgi:hypothetical protein